MLELRNISFQVPDERSRNQKEKGILKDVSMTLEDNKFVVITGQMEEENPPLRKLSQVLKSQPLVRFSGMDRTLRI